MAHPCLAETASPNGESVKVESDKPNDRMRAKIPGFSTQEPPSFQFSRYATKPSFPRDSKHAIADKLSNSMRGFERTSPLRQDSRIAWRLESTGQFHRQLLPRDISCSRHPFPYNESARVFSSLTLCRQANNYARTIEKPRVMAIAIYHPCSIPSLWCTIKDYGDSSTQF